MRRVKVNVHNEDKELADRTSWSIGCRRYVQGFGLFPGEINVMIAYWEMKEKEHQEKMKEGEWIIEVLRECVNRVYRVNILTN